MPCCPRGGPLAPPCCCCGRGGERRRAGRAGARQGCLTRPAQAIPAAGGWCRRRCTAATAALLADLQQRLPLPLFIPPPQVATAVLVELAIFSAPPVWQLFSLGGPGGTLVNPQARRCLDQPVPACPQPRCMPTASLPRCARAHPPSSATSWLLLAPPSPPCYAADCHLYVPDPAGTQHGFQERRQDVGRAPAVLASATSHVHRPRSPCRSQRR